MSTVREIYGMNQIKPVNPTKYYTEMKVVEEVKSSRHIGIEVEVESAGFKGEFISNVWKSEADGSLRNGGVEYITAPIQAHFAPQALKELLEMVLDEKECCFSPRTSIHIHVNMQDVQDKQVEDIILLYSVFERLFFKFVGRGRMKNIYCVPLGDTNCLAFMKQRELNETRSQWSKYSALNLLPISEYGTLEFRHMHGTFDVKKVTVWIRLITKLIDYVISRGGVVKMLKEMDSNYDYRTLLQSIFDTDAEYLKFQHFDDIRQGVGRMKTAFVDSSVARTFIHARDKQSPFYMGV